MYCLDASVLVNSFVKSEEHHEYSRKLLDGIKSSSSFAILPEIALPEVASAVSRGSGNSETAAEFAAELRRIPNLTFVPVDSELSAMAVKFAAENKLRGCDAVYVAVASLFKVKLITLDSQQLERSKGVVEACTPRDELEPPKKSR